MPSEEDIKKVLQNCQVCIDGVPTEHIEVAIHRNVRRLDQDGKEELITNKIRGGIGLVVCEGIAQKAKSRPEAHQGGRPRLELAQQRDKG